MKRFLVNMLTVCLFTGAHLYTIIYTIKKHSVHPIYGNYVKVGCNDESCKPWDYCPEPGVCK